MRVAGVNMTAFSPDGEYGVVGRRNMWARVQLHAEYGDANHDLIVGSCERHQVSFVPILKWGRPRPTDARTWGDWHTYVEHVVGRYPWKKVWQVWNEPNNWRDPAWLFPSPSEWRHFMDDTARTIKRVKRDALVIAGGIACGGSGGKAPPSDFNWDWFRQPASVNAVAVHTYSSTILGAATAINEARAVSEQPVWCTELGRKATVDGETRQADWFSGVAARTGSVPLFWFDYKDGVAGVDPIFDGYGAVRRNGDGRPVWYRIAKLRA